VGEGMSFIINLKGEIYFGTSGILR
jgi:hypothetical protein